MHFCHKTFPGTSNNISHRAKFQGPGCLISWLPKIRSLGLASWLSTFFSQNSALLNLNLHSSQTVYQADTSPTTGWCVRHVSCIPDTFILSLAYPWCPRKVSGVPDKSLVSQTKLRCLWLKPLQFTNCIPGWHIPNYWVVCQAFVLCPWYVSIVLGISLVSQIRIWFPDKSLVSQTKLRCLCQVSNVPDTCLVPLRHQ